MKVDFTRDGDHLVVDPETEAFFRGLDLQETHAGYHTICRSVYAAAKGDLPIVNSALDKDGVVAWHDCLDPMAAEGVSRRIDHAITEPTPPNTNVPLDASFRHDLGTLLRDVLSPAATVMIEAYMGCHFRVVQCQLYRTQTGGSPRLTDVAPAAAAVPKLSGAFAGGSVAERVAERRRGSATAKAGAAAVPQVEGVQVTESPAAPTEV